MPLIDTLQVVATAMAAADDPWWIIGSAAVRLHGVETDTADVDLLASVADARRVCMAWGRVPASPRPDARFRSVIYERFRHAPLPIEVMGGFAVCDDNGWRPIVLTTREMVTVGGLAVFVPARAELKTLLRCFGRAKDLRRATLL